MTDTPWTPAPWAWNAFDSSGKLTSLDADPSLLIPRSVIRSSDARDLEVSDYDATLIALAPEMAEAIINTADEFNRYGECGGTYDAIIELAEKLRAIGASR